MEINVENNVERTLQQLNTYSLHPRRKLSLRAMETNKKYSILFAQKTLKLNKSRKSVVRLDIDDVFIYLPKRFNQLPDSVWDELTKNKFEICKIGNHFKSCHLTFSCARTVEADTSHQFNVLEYLNNFNYSPSYTKELINESSKQSSNFVGQADETII